MIAFAMYGIILSSECLSSAVYYRHGDCQVIPGLENCFEKPTFL